ncbi:dihydropteroate synthase [Rhodococcus sp. 1163]|uniref:dihydropteroate synthase n=1 Tax=unclassified Rhodococcus (in: high G+C Gram-positive bacteria) TaxID=192944 RepID=UPI000A0DBDEC|nr:dihydropteroate synthase [Rhodococcus sp. 1163]ORI18754.1 dihydropteroate synthase [Rhodococcus sp. 1163]
MTLPVAPVVMGVLNVTADSFSDGGRYLDVDAAVAHGTTLHRTGVGIVDVGGESTRPGADRIDPAVEARRVVPVIAELSARGIATSVDTMRASVAAAAIEAGVSIVNDVSGGRADPAMASVVADAGLPWILMHWRSAADYGPDGAAAHQDSGAIAYYDDVVADVRRELLEQVDRAVAAGVDPAAIILDPGLGFAKNAEHNWELLRALPTFVELGMPILIGASRKRFLGTLLESDGEPRPPDGREVATAVVSALAVAGGAWGVRVHDAQASLDAVAVVKAWQGLRR